MWDIIKVSDTVVQVKMDTNKLNVMDDAFLDDFESALDRYVLNYSFIILFYFYYAR